MNSKGKCLKKSNLYLVLDKGSLNEARDPVKTAEKATRAGVDIIQLRDKFSCAREIIEYGKKLKKLSDSTGIPLIINDRVDICKALDADGIHLGQEDIPVKEARAILGKNKIIGVSCHSLKEATAAQRQGADYIAIGPIFKSPTKPELKPRGLKILRRVARGSKVPVVAIGGINKNNVGKVLGEGADIIAVVSAILGKKNIKKATCDLKERMK